MKPFSTSTIPSSASMAKRSAESGGWLQSNPWAAQIVGTSPSKSTGNFLLRLFLALGTVLETLSLRATSDRNADGQQKTTMKTDMAAYGVTELTPEEASAKHRGFFGRLWRRLAAPWG